MANPQRPERTIRTAALLDTGSSRTFCSQQVMRTLGVTTRPQLLDIHTLGHLTTTSVEQGTLLVRHVDQGRTPLCMDDVSTMPQPHLGDMQVATRDSVADYVHLRGLPLPARTPLEVHLLIGIDQPRVFLPQAVAVGRKDEPFALQTGLGWIVLGPTGHTETLTRWSLHAQVETCEELSRKLDKFWSWESSGLFDDTKVLSIVDKGVEALWRKTIKKQDGRYVLPIPFRHTKPELPDSRAMALRRLDGLKRRLQRDSALRTAYAAGITELLVQGYAEPAGRTAQSTLVWYIPHHPVISASKPKPRIVFDCAAKVEGVSLNDVVYQGPDYTNSLLGVLVRFRTRPIAFMADIQAMFHQVRVPEDQRDCLRFLWWPEGNTDQQPVEYRMTAHLFGGTWSPSACNFALRQTAKDHAHLYGEEAADTVRRNFYVDDCLKSVDTVEEGRALIQQLQGLVAAGGFHLTKWTSNTPSLLDQVPASQHSKQQSQHVTGSHAQEHALGIRWNVGKDTFGYAIQVPQRSVTKRGILSTLSSVFDPLGLVGPFILRARLIVQDLCRLCIGWDEPVPKEVCVRWSSWIRSLDQLAAVTFPRCLRPARLDDKASFTLHHFADASQIAYGVASYLRIQNGKEVSTSLVMAKSRLAPLKEMTIPRLELAAATLATRQDELLRRELDLPLETSRFWTDSTTVLQYICNEERRFHVFVANRVAEIRSRTAPESWSHVPTKENPADDCSRGLDPEGLLAERWQKGPAFLRLPPSEWPQRPAVPPVPSQDPEVKMPTAVLAVQTKDPEPWDAFLQHHSSYTRLVRRVALLKALVRRQPLVLSPALLRQAEHAIWTRVQESVYSAEIRKLKRGSRIPLDSPLLRICPAMHEGLLVTTGRLRHAEIREGSATPVILPAKHHVTELLLRQLHERHGHCGVQQLIAESRKEHWIVGVSVLARRVVKKCWICRRRDARPLLQRMADLPRDRVECGGAAFTNVGLDCFGPFLVKHGRKREKRYGCLFTCLSTRAIHVEVAHTLDTDSFLCALFRFIARRGLPRIIRSDNGRNFIRGEKELRALLTLWNQDRIVQRLAERGIQWIFNPPDASHMGGVWERQIRSVRRVLSGLTREQVLTDEALRTVLTIAEGIVNDRPITPSSDDPGDYQALTPNHLLILRAASIPGRDFGEDVPGIRQRWKQVLHLANLFWARWVRTYLPSLRVRTKWHGAQRNVQIGDIVLMVDKLQDRPYWPLARVVRTFPGSDGLVRSAEVRTATGIYKRPIHRLCLLEEAATGK